MLDGKESQKKKVTLCQIANTIVELILLVTLRCLNGNNKYNNNLTC